MASPRSPTRTASTASRFADPDAAIEELGGLATCTWTSTRPPTRRGSAPLRRLGAPGAPRPTSWGRRRPPASASLMRSWRSARLRRRGRARRRGRQLHLHAGSSAAAAGSLLPDVHRRAAAGRRRRSASRCAAGGRSRPPSPPSSRRAYDFVRMARHRAGPTWCLAGSHAGVSIGEDGPSQMALEDIASLRAVFGSTVLYPSDANQAAALTAQVADRSGNRLHSDDAREDAGHLRARRAIRGRRQPRRARSENDQVTLIGAGITLHESMKAADAWRRTGSRRGSSTCTASNPSTQPRCSPPARTGHRHRGRPLAEGGLGDAVLEVLADLGPEHPRVTSSRCGIMPGSATPAEELAAAGIDADAIARAARALVAAPAGASAS